MKKIVDLINSCLDCPFCQYDPDFTIGCDSGYDCKKSGIRIVDDGMISTSTWPKFPDWCPLPEATKADQILLGLEFEERFKQVSE